MYNEQLEALISAALADGVLTEKEKQILFKRAQSMGIDLDEFEMVLDARLVELQKAEKEKTEKSAPKSTKYGDVRKCPVCGALVPALSGSCPDCGYEFSGVDANLSSQKLAALIDKILQDASTQKTEIIKSDKNKSSFLGIDFSTDEIDSSTYHRIRNTIKNFSIPNTKSDLFEFTVSLQAKVNDPEYGDVYLVKLEECVAKIKLLFPNDPMFANILSSRQEQQLKLRNERKKIHMINLPIALILSVIIAFLQICFRTESGVVFVTVFFIVFSIYLIPLMLKSAKKA